MKRTYICKWTDKKTGKVHLSEADNVTGHTAAAAAARLSSAEWGIGYKTSLFAFARGFQIRGLDEPGYFLIQSTLPYGAIQHGPFKTIREARAELLKWKIVKPDGSEPPRKLS
jgi:hypothetical protein